MRKIIFGILLFSLCSFSMAQSWPTKPIRVLVGFSPGGTTDLSARVTGDFISRELGQTVIVDNRPGASGVIAIETLLRGTADGYTILVGSDSSFYQPVLNPSLPYRVDKDLRPVSVLTSQPIIIAVHPAPGWKSITEMIKTAKSRPGDIAYAISSPRGTQALAALVFFQMAKVKMTAVAYKGGGQAVVDLVSGNVPVAVLGAAPLVPQARAGRIRMIAVTSKNRSKALPDVPTLAEMGYPDMDISQWFGTMAPAGTPDEVVARLAAAYQKALADPKVGARLFDAGLDIVGDSPEQMGRRIAADIVIWAKAAKEVGMGK